MSSLSGRADDNDIASVVCLLPDYAEAVATESEDD